MSSAYRSAKAPFLQGVFGSDEYSQESLTAIVGSLCAVLHSSRQPPFAGRRGAPAELPMPPPPGAFSLELPAKQDSAKK